MKKLSFFHTPTLPRKSGLLIFPCFTGTARRGGFLVIYFARDLFVFCKNVLYCVRVSLMEVGRIAEKSQIFLGSSTIQYTECVPQLIAQFADNT